MNILKYHMKRKGLNATQLSHKSGMDYHKLCRLLRQDQGHIESRLESSIQIVHLFELLELDELAQSIKREVTA